ncbi:hypothetical protein N825_03915 [Skermanella stibiiresistens SB22]|uniref:DUF4214 domain-containing protein n=1 Tax=Skermanella stibiiresistens SB22 TaxID=1385369 RepID=W9GPK9_9PROT|nr:hypothetical protein N825_03915 [Skermanella stibiiresistens SB22]
MYISGGTSSDGSAKPDTEELSTTFIDDIFPSAGVSVVTVEDIINQQYPPKFGFPATFQQAIVSSIRPGAAFSIQGYDPVTGKPETDTFTYTDTLFIEVTASRLPITNYFGQAVTPPEARFLVTTEDPDGYRGQVWGGWLQTIDLDARLGPVDPSVPVPPPPPVQPVPPLDPRIPSEAITPEQARWTPDRGGDPGMFVSPNYDIEPSGKWGIKGTEGIQEAVRWVKGEAKDAFNEQVAETSWAVATNLFDRIGDRIGVPKLGQAVKDVYETYDLVKNFTSRNIDILTDALKRFDNISSEEILRRLDENSTGFLKDAADHLGAPGADVVGRVSYLVRETNSFEIVMAEDGKVVSGGSKTDVFAGGSGRDVFRGGAGDDTMHGQGLVDLAVFQSLRTQTSVTRDGAITRVSGADGNDILTGFEQLGFVDGTLDSDIGGRAAQIYRLYDSALDRAPDTSGLNAWVGALEAGVSLGTVAGGFMDSPEFQAKYGGLDNAGFATLLYDNVLDRAPEPEGLANWKAALDGGVARADVLAGFSESAEHVNLTRSGVDQGFWLQDDITSGIARLYYATLDRAPDAAGLLNWRGAAEAGMQLRQMADGFMGSPEFQGKYGNLDDTAFIQQLYRNVLDREGDPGGIDAWNGGMRGGLSRADVVLGFSDSPEHIAKLSPVIDDGVWVI